MKLRNLALAFTAPLALFIFSANSNGVAHEQNKDRTGAPGSQNTCQSCHVNGNFGPQAAMFLIDEQGVVVNEYLPGRIYILQTVVTANGNPAGYGAHGTAVFADGSNAGTFNDQDNDDYIYLDNVSGRHIFEQNELSPANTFEVEWVAPETGAGEVGFFVATIAANGNGQSSGDAFSGAQLTMTEGIDYVENTSVIVAPAIVTGLCSIESGSVQFLLAQSTRVRVLNISGRIHLDGPLEAGPQHLVLPSAGIYILQAGQFTQRFSIK